MKRATRAVQCSAAQASHNLTETPGGVARVAGRARLVDGRIPYHYRMKLQFMETAAKPDAIRVPPAARVRVLPKLHLATASLVSTVMVEEEEARRPYHLSIESDLPQEVVRRPIPHR